MSDAVTSTLRKLRSGLIVPEIDAVFDPEQTRPATDVYNWINTLIHKNPNASVSDPMTGFGHVLTPTFGSVPFLGFRAGYAEYDDHARKGYFTEIFTLDPFQANGFISIARVHNSPPSMDTIRVTSREEILFEDAEDKQARVRDALQPIIRDVLKDLDYGTPTTIFPDILPFEQSEPRPFRWD